MNRCTGSTMMGPCSCGLYHYQPNSFSSIFPMPYEEEIMCPYSSSPSSVDCTLSLGTPSTRLTNDHEKRRGSNWWNILQSSSHSSTPSTHKSNRGSDGTSNSISISNSNNNSDSLFSRRCANCDTTSTPLWRNGPRGPKSLCNACGIRYKKEERRANAAAAAVSNGGDSTEGYNNNNNYHHNQYMMNNGNQWMNHTQSSHKMPPSCYSTASAVSNEYRFMDDVDDRDSPFLSWRLNVTDRPGLVHDFTR